MTEWLHFATVYAQIQFATKRQLPERPGVRVYDLHEFGVVPCQPKRSRRIELDQRLRRIEACGIIIIQRIIKWHKSDRSKVVISDPCRFDSHQLCDAAVA